MKYRILALIFLFHTGISFSQNTEEVTEQKNTLQKLKTAFLESDLFNLSGYGQLVYRAEDNPPKGSAYNSMKVNRIILFATGNLNSHWSYMVMYDFGSNSGLHEIYGEYTPIDAASLRFGQYKIPFTLENPMSPTRWEGIYGSLSVNALAGISTDVIGAKAGRDMGLQLSGKLLKGKEHHYIEYSAGLFNGSGFNTPDNNNHKDFAGTLTFLPVKGLKIAGSIYSGKGYYISENEEYVRNHVRNRWSVGGEFNSDHFYIRSEYLYGNDGGVKRDGCYGIGMWKLGDQKLDIFGKYDYYNPDKESKQDEIHEITGGVNYYLGYLSRIQLNYIHTDNKSTGINNALAAQLQLFF